MKITDEAVQAALEHWYKSFNADEDDIIDMRKAIAAALPHLTAPCSVEVTKLEWRDVDAICAWCYAKSPLGEYRITWSFNEAGQKLHFPDGNTKQFNKKGFGDRDAAKAAAQADFEHRILSRIFTKPVDVAAVRRQAFEEAAKITDEFIANYIGGSSPEAMACFTVSRRIGDYIRALSYDEPARRQENERF